MTTKIQRVLNFRTIYPGWWIVMAGFFALFISGGATGFAFSVLLQPMERDLGWSRSTLVGALTVANLVGGLVGAFAGPFVDRYGARMFMVWGAIIDGLALALVSLSRSPWQYYIALGLGAGITRSFLSGLAPRAAIANWFVKKRPTAFAIFTTGSAISGIVLVPITAWIVQGWGWQAAWIFMGVALWVLVAPLSWLFVRRRPEDMGLLPDGEGKISSSSPLSGSAPQPKPLAEEPAWTSKQVLGTKAFWLLALGFVLTSLPASSIFIHMVPYFSDKGFSPTLAPLVFSIYGWGVLGGRAVWGYTIAHLGIHRALITYGVNYGICIAIFTTASSPWMIVAATILLGLATGGGQQLQGQAWPDYFGRRIVGAITGYSQVLVTPSWAGAPLLAAFVFDATRSYSSVFLSFAVACWLASLFFLLAGRPGATKPKVLAQQQKPATA